MSKTYFSLLHSRPELHQIIFQSLLIFKNGIFIGSNGSEYKVVLRGQDVAFALQVACAGGGFGPRTFVWCQMVPDYRHVVLVAGEWTPIAGCRRVVAACGPRL
uniref:Uncharacterized protein n=1 Tax=Cannabis sativa TaxID=3483 RepID=A0A803PMK3_CANSA